MIETIALIATSIWVLIGATIVMPYMVNRKLRREKTIEDLTIKATDAIEEAMPRLVTKLFDNLTFKDKVDKFKKEQLESLPQLITQAFNSEEFGGYMSDMFETAIKRLEGALYQKMGVTEEEVAQSISTMTNALNSIPEGVNLDLGDAGGMLNNVMGEFLNDEDSSPMKKAIMMMIMQKVAPGLFGGAPGAQSASKVSGLQPPR